MCKVQGVWEGVSIYLFVTMEALGAHHNLKMSQNEKQKDNTMCVSLPFYLDHRDPNKDDIERAYLPF